SMALGITAPYIITAGDGVGLWGYPGGGGEKSFNDAAKGIASFKHYHEGISNLDFLNTFSGLFFSPPPQGHHGLFDWGYNIPHHTVLNWYDVIGDACVVTIPAVPFDGEAKHRLLDVVRSKLDGDFEVVYQDGSWSIYRRSLDCRIEPRPKRY